jgi:PfaD family protein
MPYVAGAMATGVGSAELVAAMGRAGMIGFFGAGGLSLERIEAAIQKVQGELRNGESYGFNLLSNPFDPEIEMRTAELYVRYKVPRVSASGYVRVSPAIVFYRACGMQPTPDGGVAAQHRVFAKISNSVVARQFMEPPPENLLQQLVREQKINEEQARLAAQLPLADDITAEADSGGHTDNQPMLPLLSTISDLRDQIMRERGYPHRIRVGVAGGIGTPSAAMAAFVSGADYILAGSIHQSCVEANTSDLVKQMLCYMADGKVAMAPAGDMFEMGTKVQVSAYKTLFPQRGSKLWKLYQQYPSIEDIPAKERKQLEKHFFRLSFEDVWQQVLEFLETQDPALRDTIMGSPKRRMAAIFKWYLHMSSQWAVEGVPDRQIDYQVWCGPSMAAFNQWVRGSFLEKPEERRVAQVAYNLMHGAATLLRARFLHLQGMQIPAAVLNYRPRRFSSEIIYPVAQPATQRKEVQ